VWNATELIFFLILCFHAAVTENASTSMNTQELPDMAYMLANYAH